VKADFGVVIYHAGHALLIVHDAGGRVRGVALGSDALVPIVIGISGVLQFDGFERRVLARRLIKMPMNAYISHRHSSKVSSRLNAANEAALSRITRFPLDSAT